MKFILKSLIFLLIFSTQSFADIEIAKKQCEELGFTPGTEKFADCVMKLISKEKSKKGLPNIESAIQKTSKDINKVINNTTKEIVNSLKIEIAVKGKKLKNFFVNNTLSLSSENGNREYVFEEKTYKVLKDNKVIEEGKWKIYGLLKNQIRLTTSKNKKKFYLKKISKKPLIYSYDKIPGSQGVNREILHIISSSKFSDISVDIDFSSSNNITKNEETTENDKKNIKIEKEKQIKKTQTQKVEKKIIKSNNIDLIGSVKNDKAKNKKSILGSQDEFEYTLKAFNGNQIDFLQLTTNELVLLGYGYHKFKDLGLYKGESLNGLPHGLGKWSNCYSKRYEILSKYKSKAPYKLGTNLFSIEKNKQDNFIDFSCEIIVGQWENGSLNGFAKIFPLGIPKFVHPVKPLDKFIKDHNFSNSLTATGKRGIGYSINVTTSEVEIWKIKYNEINTEELEDFWKNDKNINIDTTSFKNPYFKKDISPFYPTADLNHTNTNQKNYKNNDILKIVNPTSNRYKNFSVIEQLDAQIFTNQNVGRISSEDINGNASGLGVELRSDGTIITAIYKDGAIDKSHNIAIFINKKDDLKLNQNDIGKELEKMTGYNAGFKFSNFHKDSFRSKYFGYYFHRLNNQSFPTDKEYKKKFLIVSQFTKKRENNYESVNSFFRDRNKYVSPAKNFSDKLKLNNSSNFIFYIGAIKENINDGSIIFHGKGKMTRFNGKQFLYEEGTFKDGYLVRGFRQRDTGRIERININLDFSYSGDKLPEHTLEVYYGDLNKFGPHGKGTLIMPKGMVYLGEFKDGNFSGKGELRKYVGRSGSKAEIPNLRFLLKGDFKDDAPNGNLKGYMYAAEIDAAGAISNISKKDISGEYLEGKLVKSTFVKKTKPKKLDRPIIKVSGPGEMSSGIAKAEKLAKKIGCFGHEYGERTDEQKELGVIILYPCQNYEEFEVAMKNGGKEILQKISNQKVIKKGSLFKEIYNENNESFFFKDIKVIKFKNPNKIKKVNYVISNCRIKNLKDISKKEIYFDNSEYVLDLENLVVKRSRKNKKNGSVEEKIFSIGSISAGSSIYNDLAYYEDQKNNYVSTYSSNELIKKINYIVNAKEIEIRTHPIEIRRTFDMSDVNMKEYIKALADESLIFKIQKSGATSIKTTFGKSLEIANDGSEKYVYVLDEISDPGSQISESCAKLSSGENNKIELAEKNIQNEDIEGTIEYYHKTIKESGLVGNINYGLAGEEEPYFENYQININLEEVGSSITLDSGNVIKINEVKFSTVFICKIPNYERNDLYFFGIDKSNKRFEQTNFIKEQYPKYYSDTPVYHLVRFSENINRKDREGSYVKSNRYTYDLISDIYQWKNIRNSRLPKDLIKEKVTDGLIKFSKDLTKIDNWQKTLQRGNLIKQKVEIDLNNSSIYYKHLLYFSDGSKSSNYKKPKEVEYKVNCERKKL
tara:strand:- start:881 stop:5194 length:4314 start_codon:yes stop_codon:yes gene_type:complete